MTRLVVRRLLVDLETPFARHWNGGDAFRTAFFNALSMSFPVGEQFFIDSVRRGLQELRGAERERFAAEVQGFVGQEATHRRVHALFNRHLERQGLANHWEPRSRKRLQRLEGADVRIWLGATAATEHFTAIFAEHLLTTPAVLEGAEPRLQTLWLWHASEESEHRSTAFDLYRALGGNEKWRIRLYWIVTWHFGLDLLRQTVNNLWHDGTLLRPSTWASAWRTLFAREGLVRAIARPWRQYFDPAFHPSQGDAAPGERWLAAHADIATAVAGGTPAAA
jgi:predicted metal-dependent hydrolase